MRLTAVGRRRIVRPIGETRMSVRRLSTLLLGPVACIALGCAAQARPLTPAEQRDAPYSGLVRPCEDPMATGYIQGAFADREDEYWHSGLRIVGWQDVHEIGFRSNGLDYIPRRYCSAQAIMSDQKVRTVSYSIVEAGGSIGFTDNVEWCVNGLDRLDAFNPACKMARP
jgi:hypothetical protein